MSRFAVIGTGVATIAASAPVVSGSARHDAVPSAAGAVAAFAQYCSDCHNRDDFTAEIAFDRMSAESIAHEPEIFEAAVRKLRGRLMPPPGEPRPDQPRRRRARRLARAHDRPRCREATRSRPRADAAVEPHRIRATRSRDLLGVEIDVERAAAEGRRDRRLRQHRERAQRVAGVPRAVHRAPRASVAQIAVGDPERQGRRAASTRRAPARPERPRRRHAARHARRHARRAHVPGRRRVRRSRSAASTSAAMCEASRTSTR